MFVIPAPAGPGLPGAHLRVLDPDTGQPLPPEGLDVPLTSYWFRRLADGDVIAPPAPDTPPARPRKAAQE
jgi:hypothetical protein